MATWLYGSALHNRRFLSKVERVLWGWRWTALVKPFCMWLPPVAPFSIHLNVQGKQNPLEAATCAGSLATKFQAAGMTKVHVGAFIRHDQPCWGCTLTYFCNGCLVGIVRAVWKDGMVAIFVIMADRQKVILSCHSPTFTPRRSPSSIKSPGRVKMYEFIDSKPLRVRMSNLSCIC